MNELVEKKALEELKEGYVNAQQILQDQDKVERFLQRLENKLKQIPVVGGKLSNIPILASLLNSYVKKEYTDIPLGSIVAIVSALIYFVSPIDFIPDPIPVVGYVDDAAIIAACWKMVESDLDEYTEWRKSKGRVMET